MIPSGTPPAANGEPEIGVRVPFVATLKTVMVFEPELLANKNWLSGVTPKEIPEPDAPPVGNGDPGTRVSAPVAGSIEKTLTLFVCSFAANRNFPAVPIVTRLAAKKPPPIPEPPVAKGDPAIGVKAPFASTENAETVLGPWSLLLV